MAAATHTLKGYDMFSRKLFFVVGFFLLASANCHATTVAEECAKRAKSAYDNGTTDAEKEKLGNLALSACFKEMEGSLEKNGGTDSSSSSSVVGPIIIMLVVGGFLAYMLATKGDKALSPSEIAGLREQVRELYRPDPSDLLQLRKYKERNLAEAEKSFASALSGDLKLYGKDISVGIPKTRQEINDMRKIAQDAMNANQESLDASINLRDSARKILEQPDDGDVETREAVKRLLAEAEAGIERCQRVFAEHRPIA
jgi:uncharacterized tellurite resistance protein B-like protein